MDYWLLSDEQIDHIEKRLQTSDTDLEAIAKFADQAKLANRFLREMQSLRFPANEMFRWLNRSCMDPYTQSAVNDFRKALELLIGKDDTALPTAPTTDKEE